MRHVIIMGGLLMLLAALQSAYAQTPDIARLSWLAGCWTADGRESGSGEHWLPLAGGTMLGVSRTVKGGRTVAHEFVQIRADEDGRVVFMAQPSRQKEARFIASSITQTSAVFENPQHDFPQRIMYTLSASDTLVGRIEGLREGVVRGIDFPMHRARCEELAGK